MTTENSFSIGETAKMTGVSQKQLRSWERKYIPQPERIVCGKLSYRRYSENHIRIIKKLKSYLDQGFKLSASAKMAACKTKIKGGTRKCII